MAKPNALAHLIVVLTLFTVTACTDKIAEPDRKVFEFQSYMEIERLFEELNYTQAAWDAGIREVPRLVMTNIPSRWRSTSAAEVAVTTKKQLFFRLLGPGALMLNESIEADRARLLALIETGQSTASPEDLEWLLALCATYRVEPSVPISPEDLAKLVTRVDVIPPSLVLAQAAEESGWGTSRFADVGNALFGQWTWSEGMTPLHPRAEKGDYRVARFDTPLDSVRAYMLNLNTHPAYDELRIRRREMRDLGQTPNGWELAETLTRYSERGEAYVETLHVIMRVNALAAADDAYLSDAPTIYLTPVGDGSD
jgi:uncharacterized FlgJ-related protein